MLIVLDGHNHPTRFYAGVVVENGIVVRAAPILRYMVGWHARRVINYAHAKGWAIITLE